jgi:hypothetical protein
MDASFVTEGDCERLDRQDRSFRLLIQLPDLEVVEGTFEYGWEGVNPTLTQTTPTRSTSSRVRSSSWSTASGVAAARVRSSLRHAESSMASAIPAPAGFACSTSMRRTRASSNKCADSFVL